MHEHVSQDHFSNTRPLGQKELPMCYLQSKFCPKIFDVQLMLSDV